MRKPRPDKRKYSSFKIKDAMALIAVKEFTPWTITAPPLAPSPVLLENLRRLESFDLRTTEQAKTLLIDDLFGEIVPNYPLLKVWKAAALTTDTLTGIADYLITPRRAYIEMPLLCTVEAKRDDFEQGAAQCITEMIACRWNNQQENITIDVFGIVSNGQGWQFYQLTLHDEILETELYTIGDLPRLLGVLDFVCAECAKNVPV